MTHSISRERKFDHRHAFSGQGVCGDLQEVHDLAEACSVTKLCTVEGIASASLCPNLEKLGVAPWLHTDCQMVIPA
ncbi:hypothetical protein SP41_95 [Salmonella phage 41]|nr:hypothetical protein SP41_95 [Salmonella phage 41]